MEVLVLRNIIRKYLIRRKEAQDISSILDTGVLIIQTADKMGNKKILKPSEYEIDEFKDKCLKLKEALMEVLDKFDNNNIIAVELTHQIKGLKIDKIKDCRRLGELCFKTGKLIKKQTRFNILLTPIGYTFRLNILEGTFVSIILFLILIVMVKI